MVRAPTRARSVLLGVVLSATLALPAGAGIAAGSSVGTAGPGVDLSRDRTSWAAAIDTPMFLPELAWSPGEQRTSTFFVRNDTDREVTVEVSLSRSGTAEAGLDDYLLLTASTPGGVDRTIGGGDDRLLRLRDLAPRSVAPVTLEAALSPDAPPGTEVPGDVVDFRVALQAARPPAQGDSRGLWESARLELAPLFLGLALVAAAVVASRTRRRRRP